VEVPPVEVPPVEVPPVEMLQAGVPAERRRRTRAS
jgi:hypothetical protein